MTALQQWYAGGTGQNVWCAEKQLLDTYLPGLFGYHLMTLGVCPSLPLATASPIHHCFALSDATSTASDISAYCHFHELPLDSESVDVAVLHHSLDYSSAPHQLLRETARVLMPYGSVLIFGFQRWSALGIQHSAQKMWNKDNAVAAHDFIGVHRLHDWLKLLDFDILEFRHTVYVPPQLNARMQKHVQWLERLGNKACIPWGSVYFVWARKTVAGMRVLSIEKEKKRMNPLGVLTPKPAISTTQSRNEHQ